MYRVYISQIQRNSKAYFKKFKKKAFATYMYFHISNVRKCTPTYPTNLRPMCTHIRTCVHTYTCTCNKYTYLNMNKIKEKESG